MQNRHHIDAIVEIDKTK